MGIIGSAAAQRRQGRKPLNQKEPDMAAKELRFNGDARARMLPRIDILANAVR